MLNLGGYLCSSNKGKRMNPTNFSYVGTELADTTYTITHNIIANNIVR